MPLVNIQKLLLDAEENEYAVPAFNAYNMETIVSILRTAQKLHAPVIVQVYSRLFHSCDAQVISAGIRSLAEDMNIPVALHLDHGMGKCEILRAIRYGFGSVMFDGSTLPFEQNISRTKEIVDWCRCLDMVVEGELGHVGFAAEEINPDEYTKPEDASRFAEATDVKLLAVMVGSAHGKYKRAPQLDTDRIAAIKKVTNAHIVLHGGSGIPDCEIKRAISAGIRKINVATDICQAFYNGFKFRSYDEEIYKKPPDIFMKDAISNADEFIENRIKVFGAAGRQWL